MIKKPALILTAQRMKFSIKDFFSKCDQIRSFLRMSPHLLKKTLMENFIFCVVSGTFKDLHRFNICFSVYNGNGPWSTCLSSLPLP